MMVAAQGVTSALSSAGRKVPGTAVCWIILCFALVACGGSDRRAPVEERRAGGYSGSRQYTVQRGDTLYSIAFRYGMDYRRVAAANGLSSPYTIYPGQKVQLREATPKANKSRPQKSSSSSTAKTTTAATTGKSTASRTSSKPPASSTKSSSTGAGAGTKSSSGARPALRWPSTGKVIRGYSSSVHKGIDLDGKRGDPIYAVAAGKVVYAGTGIVGFGELLIVKHSEAYLSAYGHNSRLLVAEGDSVKAGQRIAEKGNTGTDVVKLHFEIRREGKPVDPQKLLPPR